MAPNRPLRALALPALAIAVPSVFIAVLASGWLALEREAGRLRGAEAAATALEELRTSFVASIAETGRGLLVQLRKDAHAPVVSPPAWPSPVAEAFLFDREDQRVSNTAAVQGARVQRARPAGLLATGARALAEGRLADADRANAELVRCCTADRDEFGVAFVIYAAWQRLAIEAARPSGARPAALVQDLRRVIEEGRLDRPDDAVGIRLLAERLSHVPGAASLPLLVEQRMAAAEQRLQAARTAENWLASFDWKTSKGNHDVQVGPWRTRTTATIVAAWRASETATVVMVLDPQAVGDWVSRWSNRESAFTFEAGPLVEPERPDNVVLTASLFPEAPAVAVTIRRGATDTVADRQRELLFMSATGAVVVLTLVAGYLAARDGFRERRTAALRSNFLAGVTHEIKTPLTSIRLMAETLQQRRASPETAEALLATIVGEAEHLSALVDNVLGTARVESGTRRYQPRLVSLHDMVRSARERCEYALSKAGFRVTESFPAGPIFVKADPEALAQAVLNLLGNAAKYSGTSRDIRVAIATEGDEATVSVTDAGVGVPPSERESIFDSFYRGRATSETTAGTGLGLALVKHFAEAHGGRVTLDSASGHGSTFSIVLPLAAPEAAHG